MERRWLLLVAAAAGIVWLAAKYYTPAVVQYAVSNAFLMKLPADLSAEQARQSFQLAFQGASASRERLRAYLDLLFRISQKLEKVQRLSASEASQMLEELSAYHAAASMELSRIAGI